jgi:LysR family transcriptional activator of nhaA
VLADRAAPPNPALQNHQPAAGHQRHCLVCPAAVGRRGSGHGFPHSLAVVPVLLPTDHAAMRARIDHWLERERIRPRIAGEFEDSALLSTFAATGMGVMPAPVSLGEHLAQTTDWCRWAPRPRCRSSFT